MRRHRFSTFMAVAVLVVFAAAIPTAHAVLQQVGPVNNAPSVGGYPAWYQDTTGLALEFCDPKNQAEVDGGWCLLLPADVPVVPEVFPTNFADEHFYYAADASITPPGNPALRALLVLAVEAAFAGPVEPSGLMVFSRIRVRLDPVPVDGTYRFIHPYGQELIDGVASDRIFFTDDVGLSPLAFTEALAGRLGPFLLPSDTPGGLELPAVLGPAPGALYIADAARLGPVTGSVARDNPADPPGTFREGGSGIVRSRNVFRIEGPVGSNLGGPGVDAIETTDFALVGRIFQGAIAGRAVVDRASYARSAAAGNKIDVYATGSSTLPGRLPATPTPPPFFPTLAYFDETCTPTVVNGIPGPPFSAPVGGVANPMNRTDTHYFGQSRPATLPADICFQVDARDAVGNPVTTFNPVALGDQVFITAALYDPIAQRLSVSAFSSDQVVPPILTVEGLGIINNATGQLVVDALAAPPEPVMVSSSARGINTMQVSTGIVAPAPAAVDDTATTPQNTPVTISVLANDTNVVGGTVGLPSAPTLGTVVVQAGGNILYTPNLDAVGTDTFTYTVTVGAQISNVANVTVTITRINSAPTANNDSFTATVNTPATLNVLANDTDPDAGDVLAVANLSAVTPAGASASIVGNAVSFNATAAGTYTFTYQARDAAGALSITATVTVTVGAQGGATVSITRALYIVSGGRYRVEGSVTPAASQTIRLDVLNGTTVVRTDTIVSRADGRWLFDRLSVVLPNVPLTVRATSSAGTVATAPLVRQ